jgi:hypothetical protein
MWRESVSFGLYADAVLACMHHAAFAAFAMRGKARKYDDTTGVCGRVTNERVGECKSVLGCGPMADGMTDPPKVEHASRLLGWCASNIYLHVIRGTRCDQTTDALDPAFLTCSARRVYAADILDPRYIHFFHVLLISHAKL